MCVFFGCFVIFVCFLGVFILAPNTIILLIFVCVLLLFLLLLLLLWGFLFVLGFVFVFVCFLFLIFLIQTENIQIFHKNDVKITHKFKSGIALALILISDSSYLGKTTTATSDGVLPVHLSM